MRQARTAAVGVALIALAQINLTSPAAASGNSNRYTALGTSETVGLGLTPRSAYPYKVTAACNLRLTVAATVGDTVIPTDGFANADIVTVFWSPNYFLGDNAMQNLLRLRALVDRSTRSALTIVIEAPPSSAIPALATKTGFRRTEGFVRRAVRSIASHAGAKLIDLANYPLRPEKEFQSDGLHPSEAAQELLARILIDELGKEVRCSHRERHREAG